MTQIAMPRRRFLKGLGLMMAAPAVIRVANLMPIVVHRPRLRVPFGTFKVPDMALLGSHEFDGEMDRRAEEAFEDWARGNAITIESGQTVTIDFGPIETLA